MTKNAPQAIRMKTRARSGYSRKNKAPYLYSDSLRSWHESAVKKDDRGMREHHMSWVRWMALQERKRMAGVMPADKPSEPKSAGGVFSGPMRRALHMMTRGRQ